MKHVLRDIKILNKELPDGIFVRYAEDQPDYMKILIVGNQDTPYAFGLFEFDLFCSASYPGTPPRVGFCTTGEWFNPFPASELSI
jgi:ubiquitin-protein ligase